MEHRLIRIDSLLDQVGIAAALRRAFTERTIPAYGEADDLFDDLLRQIH